MKDSITHVSPALPNALSDMISFMASIVSSCVVGKSTPLPAANPDALTTCRSFGSSDLTYDIASFTDVKLRYFAVGMSCCWRKSLVNALVEVERRHYFHVVVSFCRVCMYKCECVFSIYLFEW